jgi:anhydro-N-acetylmuramic acid kinase
MEKFTALGIMSGSSLDGMDLAYCEFTLNHDKWSSQILEAETYAYTEEWILKLKELPNASAKEIVKADTDFGLLTANFSNKFIEKNNLKPELIASHGHTIFHEPQQGFTCQFGNGQAIASQTGIKSICDFRTKDVLLGGQGAPLVPIGDKLLFSDFDFCLNIGGIANISFEEKGERKAFDICGANQILNYLSLQTGKAYDENGKLAQLGKMNLPLFEALNSDSYFSLSTPKSLSNQYVNSNFTELTNTFSCSITDKLYTCAKHIAFQINEAIKHLPKGKLLISGGGAHNGFLVNALRRETKHEIIIPDTLTINFKEALIFAFMGVLRNQELANCLSSVTGAKQDCTGGNIFLP